MLEIIAPHINHTITYSEVRFDNFPNEDGIVPLKEFPCNLLENKNKPTMKLS
jgi:hypothetical protein